MADKNLVVSMQFTADTTQAKKQIKDLQTALNELMNNAYQKNGINSSVTNSIKEISGLQAALKTATSDTGKLDLTKFSATLAKQGKTITDYANTLNSMGAEGKQAFSHLAQSVLTAEVPLRRTSKLVKDLGITLKNTVKWQISANAIQAFTNGISTAYNYAQDLNRSLTDIRIVSGKSADEMARFAKEANTAAKNLSTTTTNYTGASLIYYQQGNGQFLNFFVDKIF